MHTKKWPKAVFHNFPPLLSSHPTRPRLACIDNLSQTNAKRLLFLDLFPPTRPRLACDDSLWMPNKCQTRSLTVLLPSISPHGRVLHVLAFYGCQTKRSQQPLLSSLLTRPRLVMCWQFMCAKKIPYAVLYDFLALSLPTRPRLACIGSLWMPNKCQTRSFSSPCFPLSPHNRRSACVSTLWSAKQMPKAVFYNFLGFLSPNAVFNSAPYFTLSPHTTALCMY